MSYLIIPVSDKYTHPARLECRPHPLPLNKHSCVLSASVYLASTLKLGERGSNFRNTGDIDMSVYLSDTDLSYIHIYIYIYIYINDS